GQGDDPLAVERRPPEVLLDAGAEAGERLAEGDHPGVLQPVPVGLPVGVVAVLLAAARVAAGGLEVAARVGADPHVLPRGRDHERLDAGPLRFGYERAVGGVVREAPAAADAPEAGVGVGDVDEPGLPGGLRR